MSRTDPHHRSMCPSIIRDASEKQGWREPKVTSSTDPTEWENDSSVLHRRRQKGISQSKEQSILVHVIGN